MAVGDPRDLQEPAGAGLWAHKGLIGPYGPHRLWETYRCPSLDTPWLIKPLGSPLGPSRPPYSLRLIVWPLSRPPGPCLGEAYVSPLSLGSSRNPHLGTPWAIATLGHPLKDSLFPLESSVWTLGGPTEDQHSHCVDPSSPRGGLKALGTLYALEPQLGPIGDPPTAYGGLCNAL